MRGRTLGWAAALLWLAATPVAGQSCFDLDSTCGGAVTREVSYAARFGTAAASCDVCSQAALAGQVPPLPDCRYDEWNSVNDAHVPALVLPKFVPPTAGAQLLQADFTVAGSLCGVQRLEHTGAAGACRGILTLAALMSVGSPLDLATQSPIPGFPTFPEFSFHGQRPFGLGPFDGQVDFAGPSGMVWAPAAVPGQVCVRITDPVVLGRLTDDVLDGTTEGLTFEHASTDLSGVAGCAPHTFESHPFGSLELVVRYVYCDGTSFCDAADGALAWCPCGSGNPDTGCETAQGTGGVGLVVARQDLAPANRATLTGTGFPPTRTPTVLVIRGTTLQPVIPAVFGDGVRCVALPFVHLGATFASGGVASQVVGHSDASGLYYYQLWFRNGLPGYCDPNWAYGTSSGRTLLW